ncbi:pentapeptide repeat-containing protein [Paenibacillus sp. FSL R5-0527]|uniref:pentapeptide repeat-containing protein n=1 Tax=Paenibacillus sp. FSL R5-0527 TaxID=2975321 RepID=UPI0040478F0A
MKNCIGIKASFDDANLSFADLSGSDMRRASFRRASLSYTNFYNVDLTGAIFDGALLYGASFKDAKGIDEISAQYIFVGTEDEPIKLKADNIQKWLLGLRKE